MPFGDRTGPLGLGPRTGRGSGYCAGFGAPGSANLLPGGTGFGFGRGGRGMGCRWAGRGWRNWHHATGMPGGARTRYGYPYAASYTAEEEIAFLRDEAEFLKKQLEEIQTRISTMMKTETREG